MFTAAALIFIPIVLVGAGLIMALMIKGASMAQQTSAPQDLDAKARRLLQVFTEEETKIKQLIHRYPEHPVVSGLVPDLLAEVEAMKEGSAQVVERSASLRQAAISQGRLKHQVQQLAARAAHASGTEKASIEASLLARQQEMEMAQSAEQQSRDLDAKVEQAAAELSLMRARLEQAALSTTYDSDGDSLRASLNRLQSLWSSAEEAQDLMNIQP